MKRDKKQLPFGESTLLQTALALIEDLSQRMVSVSSDDGAAYPGCEIVRDDRRDAGPLEGIARCLQNSRCDWTLFLPCDMPFLTKDALAVLLAHAKDDAEAVFFETEDGWQTFPLLLRTNRALPAVQSAMEQGERSVRAVLAERLALHILRAEACDGISPRIFININTPQTYREYVSKTL